MSTKCFSSVSELIRNIQNFELFDKRSGFQSYFWQNLDAILEGISVVETIVGCKTINLKTTIFQHFKYYGSATCVIWLTVVSNMADVRPDYFSFILRFFFQNSWDFYSIISVYLCIIHRYWHIVNLTAYIDIIYSQFDCMLNLTYNLNLVSKIFEFFLQRLFLKVDFWKWPPLSWLLNLTPSTIILV